MTSRIAVDATLCTSDGACIDVCPSQSLVLNEAGQPEETPDSVCIECGHCVAVCLTGALQHTGLPQETVLPAAERLPSPSLIDGFLRSRRSVREFKKEPPTKATLESLLDVARRAPTASNSQKLHWIVVNDAAKVRALSEETVKWLRTANLPAARLRQWENGYDFVLRGAPTVIMACTPADYEWGKQDCSIALTFLELAAEARGLGVCWAGFLTRVATVHAPLEQTLSVPNGYTVHGGLMLGERMYSYRLVPPRKPLSVQWA